LETRQIAFRLLNVQVLPSEFLGYLRMDPCRWQVANKLLAQRMKVGALSPVIRVANTAATKSLRSISAHSLSQFPGHIRELTLSGKVALRKNLAVVDDRDGRRYTYGELLDEDGVGSSAALVHPELALELVVSKIGHTPFLERPLEFQSALINHREAQHGRRPNHVDPRR
jgi:hypothetical protein